MKKTQNAQQASVETANKIWVEATRRNIAKIGAKNQASAYTDVGAI